MKKWIKITLGVIGGVVLFLIIDLICIFTIKRPLVAIKQDNGDSVNIVYKGLLYDVYNCHDYSVPQIKFKGNKFNCSVLISSYKLNNFSKIYDLDSYIEINKEKTNIIINNIVRKNNEEIIIIKDIEAKLYLNDKIIAEYEKNNDINIIVPEDEDPSERELLVELDKTLKSVLIEYKSNLTIEDYKNNYIYLDIIYKTKDNVIESERIKLFFA